MIRRRQEARRAADLRPPAIGGVVREVRPWNMARLMRAAPAVGGEAHVEDQQMLSADQPGERFRRDQRAAAGVRAHARLSTVKLCVTAAVLPSMIEAEQYFSFDSLIARSTFASERPRPFTT